MVDEMIASQTHKPILQTSELHPEDDHGCARIARVGWQLKDRYDVFVNGPVVLATHGSPAYAIIEALLDSSSQEIPVFDRTRMPEMGSVTELVEQKDGTWC